MRYLEPETVDEALGLLAEHGDAAKVIAGGQSLLILMRERLVDIDALIGLKAIAPLRDIDDQRRARGSGRWSRTPQVERDAADRRALAAAAGRRGGGLDAAGAQPRDAVRQRRPRVPDRRPAGRARRQRGASMHLASRAGGERDGRRRGLLRRRSWRPRPARRSSSPRSACRPSRRARGRRT